MISQLQRGLGNLILFVVNETSGNGRSRSVWKRLEAELVRLGTSYDRISTSSAEQARILVRERIDRGDLKAVAVVGGDGTLHGLLPLLAGSGIPLGLIPSGSGNDTARALGIPRNPLRALELIVAGHTRKIDLLETFEENGQSQHTLTAVAIGLDAAVAADVNGSSYKKWCNKLGLGSLAYVIGLLRILGKFKPRTVKVTIDGTTRHFERCWLSAVTNVPTYGGGLRISPSAQPDDRLLHVCVVHGCSVVRFLTIFPTVLFGKHVRWTRYVTMLSGSAAEIESEIAMLAFGDGEPVGHTPLRAEIRPGQLDFLISASG